MKTPISILTALALLLVLTSCNQRQEIQPIPMDDFLKGAWQIDSIFVSPTQSVTYFGQEVVNDTTFTDVGIMDIQAFDIMNTALDSDNPEVISAPLMINDKTFNFTIEKLFLVGDKDEEELFAYLRMADETLMDSDEGRFIESLNLFNRNCFLDILDENQIVFRQTDGGNAGRIFLSRM